MVMNRVVLAEFEGLEAIDDDGCGQASVLHAFPVKEKTVAAEACQVAVDSFGADA